VLRIKPGESAPANFLSAPNVNGSVPPVGTKSMFCPSCHTVSSDGSTLVMGTGPWGQGGETDVWSTAYNLNTSTTSFNGYETNNPATRFPFAGISADGKVLVENWAVVRGNASGTTDKPLDNSAASSATTLPELTGTGLETLVGSGHHTFFPAFSADNQLFVFVDSSTAELFSLDYNATTKVFSNPTKLVAKPASGVIAYPTISPDHRWVVYQQGNDYGSLNSGFLGDLWAVDTLNPLHPISLAQINTTFSAAAGTARDQHRSYEPTFAPVASGGYFWLVFHSRRTYGNELLNVPFNSEGNGTKQLWIAAIDVAASTTATTDPSHPPYWLPGQDATTLNMRGYWALDPCKGDGLGCASGVECCGGFCGPGSDGQPVCKSTSGGCSKSGDHCETAADCCDKASGTVCINHVCAEAPPPQ